MHKAVFTPANAAMLLIDHQIGTMAWTHSHDINLVKQNALKLARIAKAAGLPTVLTSSMEDQIQGPLVPELAEILPDAFAPRIDIERAQVEAVDLNRSALRVVQPAQQFRQRRLARAVLTDDRQRRTGGDG